MKRTTMLAFVSFIATIMMMVLALVADPAFADHRDSHDPPGQSGETGADKVKVCKYTGTPPGGYSHDIEVSRNAVDKPGFADAHDSIVVELGEDCPRGDPEPDTPDTDEPEPDTEEPEIDPPLDCASGPTPGSEEWENAPEWQELCPLDDIEVELGDPQVIERDETEVAESEVEEIQQPTRIDAGSGGLLPNTGFGAALLSLLGTLMLGGGVAALRRH